MRYENNPIKITQNGIEAYFPKMMPFIPEDITDIYIETSFGDRLDYIAFEFYKDPSLWWIIAAANKIHDAPIGFKPGTILRVPVNYREILQRNMQ